MEDDRSQVSDGLYMTVDQYLALDEATDGKYEYLDGYAFMLRPPSSLYDDLAPSDTTMLDMTEGGVAHAALCAHMAWVLSSALADSPCMIYSGDARLKIEIHRRDGTSWRCNQYREGDMVELKSLGVSFPFDEVYRRMPL